MENQTTCCRNIPKRSRVTFEKYHGSIIFSAPREPLLLINGYFNSLVLSYFSAFLSDFCAYLLSYRALLSYLPRTLLSQKLITNTSSPRSPLPTRLKSHKHEPPMNFDHDSSVITIDDDSPDAHRLRAKANNKIYSPVVPGSRQCTGSPEKISTTS